MGGNACADGALEHLGMGSRHRGAHRQRLRSLVVRLSLPLRLVRDMLLARACSQPVPALPSRRHKRDHRCRGPRPPSRREDTQQREWRGWRRARRGTTQGFIPSRPRAWAGYCPRLLLQKTDHSFQAIQTASRGDHKQACGLQTNSDLQICSRTRARPGMNPERPSGPLEPTGPLNPDPLTASVDAAPCLCPRRSRQRADKILPLGRVFMVVPFP